MRTDVLEFGRRSLVLMALAVVIQAHAEQPILVTQSFDFTVKASFTSSVCGFDVFRRLVGIFTITGIRRDGVVVKDRH